jgi:hypothetical protein
VKWTRRADGFASATTQLPASLDGPDSEINLRASVFVSARVFVVPLLHKLIARPHLSLCSARIQRLIRRTLACGFLFKEFSHKCHCVSPLNYAI